MGKNKKKKGGGGARPTQDSASVSNFEENLKQKCDRMFNDKEYSDAIKLNEEALKIVSSAQKHVFHCNIASCAMAQESIDIDYELVIRECDSALKLQPNYLRARLLRARTHAAMVKADYIMAMEMLKFVMAADCDETDKMEASNIAKQLKSDIAEQLNLKFEVAEQVLAPSQGTQLVPSANEQVLAPSQGTQLVPSANEQYLPPMVIFKSLTRSNMNENWLIEFAELFRIHIGFRSDACIDANELGVEACTNALVTTSEEEARQLFDKAARQFEEVVVLALFNSANVHMCAAKRRMPINVSADKETIYRQLEDAYNWVKQNYVLAKEKYEKALLLNPNFYEGWLALGQQEFEMAKLYWSFILKKEEEQSSPEIIAQIIYLFDSANEKINHAAVMWEKQSSEELKDPSSNKKDEHLKQEKKPCSGAQDDSLIGETTPEEEEAAVMKSQIHLLLGNLLFERSQIEWKLSMPGWNKNLVDAVERFKRAGASEAESSTVQKYHGSTSKDLQKQYNLDLIPVMNDNGEINKISLVGQKSFLPIFRVRSIHLKEKNKKNVFFLAPTINTSGGIKITRNVCMSYTYTIFTGKGETKTGIPIVVDTFENYVEGIDFLEHIDHDCFVHCWLNDGIKSYKERSEEEEEEWQRVSFKVTKDKPIVSQRKGCNDDNGAIVYRFPGHVSVVSLEDHYKADGIPFLMEYQLLGNNSVTCFYVPDFWRDVMKRMITFTVYLHSHNHSFADPLEKRNFVIVSGKLKFCHLMLKKKTSNSVKYDFLYINQMIENLLASFNPDLLDRPPDLIHLLNCMEIYKSDFENLVSNHLAILSSKDRVRQIENFYAKRLWQTIEGVNFQIYDAAIECINGPLFDGDGWIVNFMKKCRYAGPAYNCMFFEETKNTQSVPTEKQKSVPKEKKMPKNYVPSKFSFLKFCRVLAVHLPEQFKEMDFGYLDIDLTIMAFCGAELVSFQKHAFVDDIMDVLK